MTELSGFGVPDWLPLSARRAMLAEERQERLEARRAEQEREERAEAAAEKSLLAYRDAAGARGEVVSAMALATGNVPGRTLDDVFADATRAADREDQRDRIRQQREASGELVHVEFEEASLTRAAERNADRLARRYDELHRARVEYEAHRNRTTFDEAMAARSRPMIHR